MILAALCRGVENLHKDMSYVLIGGLMWKINGGNDLGGGDWASSGGDSTLSTSDGSGAIRRGNQKGLLNEEVEAAENTNKNKIVRHKKVRVVALIPF